MNAKEIYKQVIDDMEALKISQITQKEFDSNFKFFPEDVRSEVEIKLDKNGFLKRASSSPMLCKEIKQQWDTRGLKDLLEHGSFTFKPSNSELLKSIVNASKDVHSDERLIVIDFKTNDEHHPTMNNGNSSDKARKDKARKDRLQK